LSREEIALGGGGSGSAKKRSRGGSESLKKRDSEIHNRCPQATGKVGEGGVGGGAGKQNHSNPRVSDIPTRRINGGSYYVPKWLKNGKEKNGKCTELKGGIAVFP